MHMICKACGPCSQAPLSSHACDLQACGALAHVLHPTLGHAACLFSLACRLQLSMCEAHLCLSSTQLSKARDAAKEVLMQVCTGRVLHAWQMVHSRTFACASPSPGLPTDPPTTCPPMDPPLALCLCGSARAVAGAPGARMEHFLQMVQPSLILWPSLLVLACPCSWLLLPPNATPSTHPACHACIPCPASPAHFHAPLGTHLSDFPRAPAGALVPQPAA